MSIHDRVIRLIGSSTCFKRRDNDAPCPIHANRPAIFVSYRVMDLEGIGWADVEADADAIARADLVKKLRQKAQELLSQAGQLNDCVAVLERKE